MHECNLRDDFGAVGDGVTDNFNAIKAAIAAVPSEGGRIICPAGDYFWNQEGELWIPNSNIILEGEGPGMTVFSTTGHYGWRFTGQHVTARGFSMTMRPPPSPPIAAWGGYTLLGVVGPDATDVLIEDVTIHDIYCTAFGVGASPERVRFNRCRAENLYEHGFYIGSSKDSTLTACTIKDPRWSDGTFANPHTGTVAYKVSYDNPGLKLLGCTATLGITGTGGYAVGGTNFGDITVAGCSVRLRSDHQTGIGSNCKGAVLFSDMIVDGGDGYVGTWGATISGSAGDPGIGSVLDNVYFSGRYTNVIAMGQSSGAKVSGCTIDRSGDGYWAIELQNAISPQLIGNYLKSGTHGVSLGASSGACLYGNTWNASIAKYDTSAPSAPSGFSLRDHGTRRTVTAGTVSLGIETDYVGCDASAGAVTVVLNHATRCEVGQRVVIQDEGDVGTITVQCPGGATFNDGTTSKVVIPSSYVAIRATGALDSSGKRKNVWHLTP